MNSKKSLDIMAILAVLTLLALPPASATEHDVEDTLADDNAITIAAAVESRIAPAKPSQVFVGLTLGIILCRPISEPSE